MPLRAVFFSSILFFTFNLDAEPPFDCAPSLAAETVSKIPPLLFRVTNPSGKLLGYLFGTMHVKISMDSFSFPIAPFIDSADIIFVESYNRDRNIIEVLATLARYVFSSIRLYPSLSSQLTAEEWALLKKEAKSFPPILLNRMHPMMATILIGLAKIDRAAKAAGLNEENKEMSIDRQIELLSFPTKPIRALDPAGVGLGIFKAHKGIEELKAALIGQIPVSDLRNDYYINGSFEQMEAEALKGEANRTSYYVEAVIQRNRNWIPKLSTQIEWGKRFFGAVGAGHLGGNYGVLQLLKNRGLLVERVTTSYQPITD